MADKYGAMPVPLASPSAGEVVADPLIFYCLQFFQAIANAYTVDAWQEVAPSTQPIAATFAHDPQPENFNAKFLPALFMWREAQTKKHKRSLDVDQIDTTIKLLWVPPPATQDKRSLRMPFAHGLFAALDVYFERGRDPAWRVPDDSYPTLDQVATYGSVLPHWAGYKRMYLDSWKREPIAIPIAGANVTKAAFDGWEATLLCEEWLTPDLARYAALAGIDMKIKVPTDGTNPEFTLFEHIAD